jgi:hypothetical protein
MPDIASLVLAVDATQVKSGTAALDGLTAAGTRAQFAAGGLAGGMKGAGAEATAMAAAAQASARAAANLTTNFTASANAAKLNTVAMRETLVVARELSRGNFTRIPGSLSLLAQGISSQGGGLTGFISALSKSLGLIKTVQDAELAEQAANAAASASAIQNAALRAQANIQAADTELALAQAQARVTAGTSAEAAAQVRLAEAHQAVAAAAAEAAIAEDALNVAATAANDAAAAAEATTVTTIGSVGLLAAGLGLAAVAYLSVKDAAEQTDPAAKEFIATLGLTDKEIKKLKDTTVTWGDVARGTFAAVAHAAGTSGSQVSGFFHEAFLETAQVGVSAAQVILAAFAAMVKGVHSLLGNLPAIALGVINPSLAGLAGQGVANAGGDALAQFKKTFGDVGNFIHVSLPSAINSARDARLQKQADALISDRSPGKAGRSGAARAAQDASDATKDWLANLDELLNKQQDVSDLLKGQKPLVESTSDAEAVFKTQIDGVEAAVQKLADTFKARQDTLMHFADEFGGAIADVVSGTKSLQQAFSDLARSVIAELVQMTVKMLLFRAISSAFPSVFGPTSGGGIFGSAKGNVFSGGNVVPFALGGVVNGPTMFPMNGGRTGLMGEAGPEAVMPLTRDSQGRLGVRAANSNAPAIVEIHVVRGELFEQVVGQISGNVAVKVVQAAAPEIAQGAAQGILKTASRPKLMGRG